MHLVQGAAGCHFLAISRSHYITALLLPSKFVEMLKVTFWDFGLIFSTKHTDLEIFRSSVWCGFGTSLFQVVEVLVN